MQAVVQEMKSQNIMAGNFYWFDNNWHYIRKWDHLKNSVMLNPLHPDLKAEVMKHANKSFEASDAVLSRCISTAISLTWTEDQIADKGTKIVSAINKVLAGKTVSA